MAVASSEITFSIVSHAHGVFIDQLLNDFYRLSLPQYEIVLTLNIKEDEAFISKHAKLPLRVIRNSHAKGFGENHNQAFRISTGRFFSIVNPDVRLSGFDLDPLLGVLADPKVGLCAPLVYSSQGELQDSARRFPTIGKLLARRFSGAHQPDYAVPTAPIVVDWVAGMFMVFRREVYEQIGGFDERFFMYLEDVDMGRRLAKAGKSVMLCPAARVIHDAQRASQRNIKHLSWHLRSAFRYFTDR